VPRRKTVCRTRLGRLTVFDRAVTALRTESAGNSTWSVQAGQGDDLSMQEPPREARRSFLMAVRAFDSPDEDVYLKTIFKDVESFELGQKTQRWVGIQRAAYESAKVNVAADVSLNGKRITPRECFEMLAYTEDLHFDAENEIRQRSMDPFIWQLVRMFGSAYVSVIANAAIVLRSLARDDPATARWFVPREAGKESAVEWLEAHSHPEG
jgi:hypothetical protein